MCRRINPKSAGSPTGNKICRELKYNDIIDLYVDMNKNTMHFLLNGEYIVELCQGEQFDKNKEYSLFSQQKKKKKKNE